MGTTEDLLSLAAAAEGSSEHPRAQAVVEAAFDAQLTPPQVETFEAIAGKGVTARIDGADVLVGSPRFLSESGVDLKALGARIDALEDRGHTVIAVARDAAPLGLLALGDLRSEEHTSELQSLM